MEGIKVLIVFKILVKREKFVEFPRYNVFREFCFQLLIHGRDGATPATSEE